MDEVKNYEINGHPVPMRKAETEDGPLIEFWVAEGDDGTSFWDSEAYDCVHDRDEAYEAYKNGEMTPY